MKPLGFFHLKGIGGQIAALVLASTVALHLVVTAAFLISRPDRPDTPPDGAHQLTDAALLLGSAEAGERPRLVADLARAFPKLGIEMHAPGTAAIVKESDGQHLRGMRRHLGRGYKVVQLAADDTAHRVGVELPDGSVIAGRVDGGPRPWFWGAPWLTALMTTFICVTVLGLWAARALAAPLSSFAEAAENFSLDGEADPLPERGPEEIRSVARALNRMHERIARLMSDRTRMLAAISHDLRTPITRLRLRAEFIEDEVNRKRMLMDLDQMRSMLESVLSLLRNDRKIEAVTLVDIASTLQLIADQFGDMGHVVHYDGPASATAAARPDDLHRASPISSRTPCATAPRSRSASTYRAPGSSSTSRTTAPAFRMHASRRCWSRSRAATMRAPWTSPPASASACRSRTRSPSPTAGRCRCTTASRTG